jgi:hypothetical protein
MPARPHKHGGRRKTESSDARQRAPVSFRAIRRASVPALKRLLAVWLPAGRLEGDEWVAFNPRRTDRTLGSFKINLRTGRWADFATGDRGGDAISLLAYLRGLSQAEAARLLAQELRVRL